MATREIATREIASEREFEDFLDELNHASEEAIDILVPEDAPVLRTAEEFRTLAGAARNAGINLRVDSGDPLRQQFATIFGIGAARSEEFANQTTRVGWNRSRSEAETRETLRQTDQGAESDASQSRKDLAAYRAELFDDDASYSFVITPPRQRVHGGEAAAPPAPRIRPRSAARSRARFLFGFATVGVLSGVVILMIGILAPWMRVEVVPATGAANLEVTYGIEGAGAPLDVSIPPREISTEVTHEESIATTGERTEPDGIASGTVTITNASTSEQFLEAGTQLLTADESVTVALDEDVYVPPADPFGTMTFGSATVAVSADVAGPDGNLGEGQISGQLSDTLFYSNRSELTGGTLRSIPVVAEEDIEKLRGTAEGALLGEVDAALEGEVASGEQMIEDSVNYSEITYEFSHEPGEDAESVTVQASMSATAEVFDPEALHEAGEQMVAEELPGHVDEDQELLGDEVSVSSPERIGDGPYPSFRIEAEAPTRAVIERSKLDRLEDALVGADQERAGELLDQLEGVERYEISRGPDWLPASLPPRLHSRIAIDVETVTSSEEQAGTTR
ncbi:MAG: hypothetical protein ACOC9Y_03515 [Chloroflexota bacterium]